MRSRFETLYVVNPASLGGSTKRRWRKLEKRVREIHPDAEVWTTSGPGDERAAVAAALEAGARRVVAVGGDGTLHHMAAALLGDPEAPRPAAEQPALGLLPSGSGNDLARGLGIPLPPSGALEVLAADHTRPLDAGLVRCAASAGEGEAARWFLNAADFGVGAEVVRRMGARRSLLGRRFTYFWHTLRALVAFENPEVALRLDGGPEERRRVKTVAVCNLPWFGGGMCVAPDARGDDGVLAATVFGDLGRLEAMRRLGETYRGGYVQHADIHYRSCAELRAESGAEVHVEADGEYAGRLPARFTVRRHALRLIAPAPAG